MSLLRALDAGKCVKEASVRKTVSLVVLLLLVLGAVGLAQTAVTPRAAGESVFLFDNATGATITKLGIVFDKTVTFTKSDVIAIGGDAATLVAISNNFAFIDVVVVPGGTLQVTLSGDRADAVVTSAFWFE